MPSFEQFFVTALSARSILVNFTLRKNLTSNSSKPIGVLKTRNLWKRENREPMGYSLPDFQPHWSNVFDSLHFFTTSKEGGRHEKKSVLLGVLRKWIDFVWLTYLVTNEKLFARKKFNIKFQNCEYFGFKKCEYRDEVSKNLLFS